MKRTNETHEEDVDYWRSMADVVLGLLLVVLLALSLLILGLMDKPVLEAGEEAFVRVEESPTPSTTPSTTPSPTLTPTPTPTMPPIILNNGGGGGGGGGGDDVGPGETSRVDYEPTPTPYIYDALRCAVRVTVRDEETRQMLLKSGISFELYDNAEGLKSMGVYYPERIIYEEFETNKGGSFYLPEKLDFGEYRLRNLVITQEYDLSEDVRFTVEEPHDWSNPLVVDVLVSPCKNRVKLQAADVSTGIGLPNGLYEIVAAENVITADGTRRYTIGEVVDTFSCNEDGEALSKELYLGNFLVRQSEAPFSYARILTDIPVSLERRASENDSTPVPLTLTRTSMTIVLRDELHQTRLEGASYRLIRQRGEDIVVTTDSNGEICLTELDKDAQYHLIQSEKYGRYRMDTTDYTFTVDKDGYIDGEAEQSLILNARILRCELSAKSALLGTPLTGQDMALFNADGELLGQWNSSTEPQTVEGIEPGEYTLSMAGQRMNVTVQDVANVQSFVYRVWGKADLMLIVGIGIVGGLLMIALIVIMVRRNKKSAVSKKSKANPAKRGKGNKA